MKPEAETTKNYIKYPFVIYDLSSYMDKNDKSSITTPFHAKHPHPLSHSSHSLLLPLSNQTQLTRDDVKDLITTCFSICISHIYYIKRWPELIFHQVPPVRQSPQHGENPAANASVPTEEDPLSFTKKKGHFLLSQQKLKEAFGGRILLPLKTKKRPFWLQKLKKKTHRRIRLEDYYEEGNSYPTEIRGLRSHQRRPRNSTPQHYLRERFEGVNQYQVVFSNSMFWFVYSKLPIRLILFTFSFTTFLNLYFLKMKMCMS